MATGAKYGRVDTAANFTSSNPTLALGEDALETDTLLEKVGDGSTAWTSLGYRNIGPISKTAATWTSDDTVLPYGQWGIESDTGKTKRGDGSTAWTSLYYRGSPPLVKTAAQWTSDNDVLPIGEEGIESDTLKKKIGDGSTAWNSLAYESSGGGSGTGSLTFLYDDFEGILSGWNTYADAAGATPVDGTGGTPTVTAALNTSSPLLGNADLIITKDAADRQGEGVSKDFTIDSGALGQVHAIEFYVKNSANFATGDVGVYIYDVTNSTLMYASVTDIAQGADGARWMATFIPSSSTSYRLIFHVQTTNASAWTLEIDNVSVGPFEYPIGAAIGGWTAYTPTVSSGAASLSITEAFWKRNGSSMDLLIKGNIHSPSANTLQISLPDGKTVGTISAIERIGIWARGNTTANAVKNGPVHVFTGDNFMTFGSWEYAKTFNPLISYLGSDLFADGDSFEIKASGIPIAQWSDSVNLVSDVEEYVFNTSTSTTTSDTTSFGYGRGGALIGSITAQLNRRVRLKHPLQNGDMIAFEVSEDGSKWSQVPYTNGSTGIVVFNGQNTTYYGAGQFRIINSTDIDISFGQYATGGTTFSGAGTAWSSGAGAWYWRVHIIRGGGGREVPPVVRADCTPDGTQSLTASGQLVQWNTVQEDTHNAVTTGASWKFTAPMDGVYAIRGLLSVSGTPGTYFYVSLYKNGVQYRRIGIGTGLSAVLSYSIRLAAGDYISTYAFYDGTPSTAIVSSPVNAIAIERIGS